MFYLKILLKDYIERVLIGEKNKKGLCQNSKNKDTASSFK